MQRILFVASELYPHAKTGGLADVIAALPRALLAEGLDVRLVLPGYPRLLAEITGPAPRVIPLPSELTAKSHAQLLTCRLNEAPCPVYLVTAPDLFDDADGLYGGGDSLQATRFGTLSRYAAALAVAGDDGWRPDLVHVHDWHAAMTPVFAREMAGEAVPPTVLTIHNLAFQGVFPRACLSMLGLPPEVSRGERFAQGDTVSFLEEGLIAAHHLTTVSPTYAEEIASSALGFGFEGLLGARRDHLTGILNGVDYTIWHPELDPHLPRHACVFDAQTKAVCKQHVQTRLGLPAWAGTTLIGFTNRLTHQKMIDVIIDAIPALMDQDLQLIIHGSGDRHYEEALYRLAATYPDKLAVLTDFQEELEHQIHAGTDFCLSPSRFEPCGLNPLYALRYGAIPIVRRTGGIADTVVDVTPVNADNGTANGIVFEEATTEALIQAIHRAMDLRHTAFLHETVIRNAVRCNFGWRRAAMAYRGIYDQVLGLTVPATMPDQHTDQRLAG